jgi:hypothetical protein
MEEPAERSGSVFACGGNGSVAMELRVSFGLFVGRDATGWEIERLGASLLDEVDAVTVISEQRHEIGRSGGGLIHLVRVELAFENAPESEAERRELEERFLQRTDQWVRECFADRHGGVEGR